MVKIFITITESNQTTNVEVMLSETGSKREIIVRDMINAAIKKRIEEIMEMEGANAS